MKYLIKFLAIIGLVSMSHVAFAIDNVVDGDILEAAGVNEMIDATNANTDDIAAGKQALRALAGSDGSDLEEGDVVPNPPPPACGAVVGIDGPGGGMIFLVSEDGCKGLEASKADLNSGAVTQWGCMDELVGAVGQNYGDGRTNTGYILNAGCTDGNDAADLANDFVWPMGKTDGYLPAQDELEEMWVAIGPGADNAGGFDTQLQYWTSTEDSLTNALAVHMSNGRPFKALKDVNLLVRAVRVFDLTP